MKDIQSFLKKEKIKGEKMPETDIKIFLKKKKIKGIIRIFLRNKKKKIPEYRRNYYLAHKKITIKRLCRFFKDILTIQKIY